MADASPGVFGAIHGFLFWQLTRLGHFSVERVTPSKFESCTIKKSDAVPTECRRYDICGAQKRGNDTAIERTIPLQAPYQVSDGTKFNNSTQEWHPSCTNLRNA